MFYPKFFVYCSSKVIIISISSYKASVLFQKFYVFIIIIIIISSTYLVFYSIICKDRDLQLYNKVEM